MKYGDDWKSMDFKIKATTRGGEMTEHIYSFKKNLALACLSVVKILKSESIAEIHLMVECPECSVVMSRDEDKTIQCLNSSCSLYEVRFKQPTVKLERVRRLSSVR